MKKRLSTIMAILLALSMVFIAGPLMAGDSARQTVSYEVNAINDISVSGDPAAMNVSTATAGSEPDEVSDATTTYAITTNAGTGPKKIMASINTPMPDGVTLKINLAAPTGATSSGDIDISNAITAVDVVTAINSIAESGKTITYKLSATLAASEVSDSKTVTLTIVDS
jgi:hypothetical protein